jgi:thymidylate kinase
VKWKSFGRLKINLFLIKLLNETAFLPTRGGSKKGITKMRAEVAIIGVDGSGKSAAGKAIHNSGLPDVKVNKITNYEYNGFLLRNMGKGLDYLSGLGDRRDSKIISGTSYLGCLLLSPMARMGSRDKVIVWERHPRYDAEAYARIYSSSLGRAGQILEAVVIKALKAFFPEPSSIIRMKTLKDTALLRVNQNHERQIHENPEDLENVILYFDDLVAQAKEAGYPQVIEIETDDKNTYEANEEIMNELERIIQGSAKQRPGLLGRGRNLVAKHNPLAQEKLHKTIDDLVERGTIPPGDAALARQLVGEQEYTSKHLTYCVITSIITPGDPAFSTISSLHRIAWNLSWTGRELLKGDLSKVGVHLSAAPINWIPHIGGLAYLIPLCLKSPEAGMLYAYQICNSIPGIKRYPDALVERLGQTRPARKIVSSLDNVLGKEAQEDDYKLQLRMRPSASTPKEYITNFGRTFKMVFKDLMIPYFLKGARNKD